MPRFLKQFIYGFLYFLLLAIVAGILYLMLRPSETCFDGIQNQNELGVDCGGICGIDCELKYIQPLVISQPIIFKSNNLVSFIAQIKNPNPSYGSDRFGYKVNFYDSQDKLLKSVGRTSFIYAAEIKNIIEAGVQVSGSVYRGEAAVDAENINWRHFSEWQAPILETSNIKSVPGEDMITVTGLIKNPSNFLVSRVIISAVLKDVWGMPVGVSKTEINNLVPFQTNNFQIFVPFGSSAQKNLDLNSTQILIEAKK